MIYPLLGKRIFDIVTAVILAVPVVPLLGFLYVCHKIKGLDGPFLFRQQRVGRGGQPFTILKLRTMDDDGNTNDFTKFLRKSSFDELPQIFNVLSGDMSLIGVRPEVWSIAEAEGIIHHQRHDLKPGVTGPTQVTGERLNRIVDNVETDRKYVENVSLAGDVKILLKTPFAIFSSKTT